MTATAAQIEVTGCIQQSVVYLKCSETMSDVLLTESPGLLQPVHVLPSSMHKQAGRPVGHAAAAWPSQSAAYSSQSTSAGHQTDHLTTL